MCWNLDSVYRRFTPEETWAQGEQTMKSRYTIALSTLTGMAIGATAIQTLHAQAKPPVYAIALNQLTDAEGYAKDYLPKGRAAIIANGGVYVAAGKGTLITGNVPSDRVTVLRFESLDAVKEWFNSPEYQAANQIGQKYAKYNIIAVDGVPKQ
jgi:uncharacterized protein (DUF1330 family)